MGLAFSSIETQWNDAMTLSYNEGCLPDDSVQVINGVNIILNLPNSCVLDDVDIGNRTYYQQNCVLNNVINIMQNFAENNSAFASSTFSLSDSSAVIGIGGQELLNQYVQERCGGASTTQIITESLYSQNGGCPKTLELTNYLDSVTYCAVAAFTSDVQSFAATNQATAKTIGILSGIISAVIALIVLVIIILAIPSILRKGKSQPKSK